MTEQEKKAALDAFNHWLFTWQTDPEVNKHVKTIRAALSSPAVPVIEGLDDKIVERIYDAIRLADKEYDGIHEGTIGTTRKEYTKKAIARAYAALPKMQKVDLDGMKYMSPYNTTNPDDANGYNRAIDDLKSKYGELYAEVK